ncbi:MAG: helicase/secretion neighborhood TadE-like protein [Mycobacterium sp.]|jgi:secretion/DNA translocation related TadE-like protein|nr:helicase/secretion neighborhood TadE-like protein [Mycobacterium sp.]
MIAVLLVITVGGVFVGSVVVARHRAQAAAELAALAAAGGLTAGTVAACARASGVARAMGAGMDQCVVDGLDVVVTVDAAVTFALWGIGPARAAARAGPG